jgi:Tfp pilus assembly protein PilE
MRLKGNTTAKFKAGFVSMEIIIYLIIAGIILGGLFLVTYPSIKSNVDSNNFKSEYTVITQGLNQYYSNNYQYPKATGWGWDSADTYVVKEVKGRGWNYSCTGTVITITTPTLDAKTHQKLREAFTKASSGVSVAGSKLNISLNNKPCP